MSHRIVIVGGGAAGLELATRLGRTLGKQGLARVTLVDANLTHVWKPLLHEVAAGVLNSSVDELNYVAQARWNHFNFQLGRMMGLDRDKKTVRLAAIANEQDGELVAERELGYDTLVIAVGSQSNDFGTPGVAENCIFLDSRAQADRFHRLLLQHYMRASSSPEGDANHKINVAIVGAGATGVELSAELRHTSQELAEYGLAIRPEDVSITLIEAGARILPALPERLSVQAAQALSAIDVTVLTGSAVREVGPDSLTLAGGEVIPAHLRVWAAGIRAPAFLKDLGGLENNRINQLLVLPTLQTTRDENIFALGDCAACPMGDGKWVPPRAQAARQQTATLARTLERRLRGRSPIPFAYKDYGSLVSLSRFSAVGNLMGNLTGTHMIEGRLARMFYISLYRMHQMALYGKLRTLLLIISGRLGRSTAPRLKLH
ncbi:NAD(P)/FAD-dependent oxidoreductase [Paludibacterium yongneupense]|uniref:NAD(P)/FAD-dependent oxidoreductase n=1 Tax=Paludibacterium yongneupense TaxID=400061 RepID=UPI00041E54AF|nr:NAD(P)/FAD-dependent oxidoreductase [Paludibacterium yongneupense]